MSVKQAVSAALSSTARSAIVAAYVEAITTNESSGSLVTHVCDVAQKYAKGEPIGDEDRSAIVSAISRARGWKGKSAKSRQSEVNVVLKSYSTLPEAVEAFTAKAKRCYWHDSMKLARRLNAGDSIAQAVRAAFTTGGQSAKSTPSGRVAGALKAWAKAEPRKQRVILEAAALLGIKLGKITLDA